MYKAFVVYKMTHTIVTRGMKVRTHTRFSYAATLTRTHEHMQEERNSPYPAVDYHMTIAYLSSASDLEFSHPAIR